MRIKYQVMILKNIYKNKMNLTKSYYLFSPNHWNYKCLEFNKYKNKI